MLASAGAAHAAAPSVGQDESYANYLIARYAEQLDDPAKAADYYARALRTSPKDPVLVQGAADASLAVMDIAGAARIAKNADKSGAAVPVSATLAAAAEMLMAGKPQKAHERLADLSAGGTGAEDLAAKILLVWSDVAGGAHEEALQNLDIDPSARGSRSVQAVLGGYQRAMLLDMEGKTEAAGTAFAEARKVAGALHVAQLSLQHGEFLERNGRKAEAIALYKEELRELPNPALALALARAEAGGAPPAAPGAMRAAAISLYALAMIASYPTQQDQLEILALSITLDGTLDGSRLAYADAMRAIGQSDRARTMLQAIAPTSPFYEAARLQIGWSLVADGLDDRGVAELAALCKQTGSALSCRNLGDVYRSLERYADAAPIYAKLIADAPKDDADWRLYYHYGSTLERLGKWNEAEAALQKALELSPEQPDVLNYLGYTWVERGEKVQEGLKLLERAVAQRPSAGYMVDSLAWAHFRLGNYRLAEDLLERAVELSPGDPTLNDHLGDCYWRNGRQVEARYQWKRVLTLTPGQQLTDAVNKKIRDGLPGQGPATAAASGPPSAS